MTSVKFNRKEFEKQIKLTDEVIEKIPLFGTPLESISDEEVEVEVFPNRPDLISLQGYLRSFKQFLGKDLGLKDYPVSKPKENFKSRRTRYRGVNFREGRRGGAIHNWLEKLHNKGNVH